MRGEGEGRARRRFARALRDPALHFAAIGALLFAAGRATGLAPAAADATRAPIVVSAAQVEKLLANYRAATGLVPTRADAHALVEREIETEALYREALALGLDRGDRGVAWRLIEKMSFLADEHEVDRHALLSQAAGLALDEDDLVVRRLLVEKMRLRLRHEGSIGTPTDAELEGYLAAHADRFRQPARLRLSQVFFSRSRAAAREDAAAAVAPLRADAAPAQDLATRGDPLPVDRLAIWTTQQDLVARFGSAVATGVAALPPGVWSDPIASPYGWHVLLVHERVPERLPALAEVRGQALYGLLADRRAAALLASTRALRAEYEVSVEWPPGLEPAAATETAESGS